VRYAAALPSAGLIAGAAVGLLVDDSIPSVPLVTAMTATAAVAVASVVNQWARRDATLGVSVVVVFFAGGVLLAADAWRSAWRPPLRTIFEELAARERAEAEAAGQRRPLDDEASVTVEGILRADASLSAAGVSLSLAVDRVLERDLSAEARRAKAEGFSQAMEREGFGRASGGLLLTVTGQLARERAGEWRAGRRVRLPARIQRPQRYLDPGVADAERSLARRGTTLVGTVKSGALVEVIRRGPWWDEALSSARQFARAAIARSVDRFSLQSGGIVAAIVIGDRSRLEPDVQRRLQEAGTYHVVAISGGNIAILAGVLLWAFRVAGWFGRTAMLAAIALLCAYARFVGGGASVDRATLMAVVYLGARVFDLRTPPLNALIVVAAVLVASDPLSVADPAFLLTCGATLAILVAPTHVDRQGHGGRFQPAAAIIAASAAAEIMLLPVGALLFARVTFAGLVLNLFAIPLMGVAQIAGMLVIPAAAVWAPLAMAAGWVAHIGAQGLVWSADLVQFAPAISRRVAPPSAIACAVYYAGLVITYVAWRGARPADKKAPRTAIALRAIGIALWSASGLWILWNPALTPAGDGRLHVTFLDVGQGDATFVVFPRGATLLVDAGGLGFSSSFDIGDRVVAPVIRSMGYRRIDRLAITHGDPDHVGGAMSVLREFRPREVWEGIPVPRSDPLTALRVGAQSLGARWANVYAGDAINVDGVDVLAHFPFPAEWERQKVRNDDSLVLELRWREVSILLTGDIGRQPESGIASGLETAGGSLALRPVRVVKIPHHGSLTSSSARFVETVRPQFAVVSAGRSNHFGHPVPEVLERYRAVGAQVFRTDRDGAVFVETDGRTLSVRTNNSTETRHENTK